MDFAQYTAKNTEEVLDMLKTSEEGLSEKEVVLRQQKYGLNEIKAKNVNAFNILIRQFKSPFFYLLFAAVLLSFFIGERVDSLAILAFVVLNVAIGFFQEHKAEKAVFLLRKFIPQKTKVLRDGKEKIIERKDLVPGDICLLEPGDIVPADMRIIYSQGFLVDESILTGESAPVSKTEEDLKQPEKELFKAKNILFSGTAVISGKAKGVVFNTGKSTVFGEIAKMVSGQNKKSAYEESILYFSKLILKIVAVTIILIFAANLLLKGISDFFNLLFFSVALIVSILPEALPAVVTFSLSRGAIKMAKENVVVKRLSAIEDLGNIDVLCADKTGTLTKNKLSLEKIVSSDQDKCFLFGLLSSGIKGEEKTILNPYDTAILEKAQYSFFKEAKKFKAISELPFDPFKMRAGFLVENQNGEKFLIVKGAAENILKSSTKISGRFEKKEIMEDIEREGQAGKRVLAVAFKKIGEKGLTFLGYFVFYDPLKPTAKEAISLAKKLGVQIKIITGDSKEVAGYVAKMTGLIQNTQDVVLGQELDKMPQDDFEQFCEEKFVFARVSPETKNKIIKCLQKNHEVGFMGEGVNDAPALKAANVAIAVDGASDVSREVSDIVLLQKDLRVIVNGIKDGRMIFSNINKYIKCALASNFGNFYSIAVISLFINFLPMLPVQILLGNLLSDFPLISIATDSLDVEELKKPKMYQLHMVLPLIISLALVSTVFDFIFFSIFYKSPPSTIQTLWFIESILTEILLIFIIRTRHLFWKAKKPSFWLLLFTIIDGIFIVALPFLKFGQNWFHLVSPPILSLLTVFFLIINYFIVSEVVKLIYFHYWKPSKNMIN